MIDPKEFLFQRYVAPMQLDEEALNRVRFAYTRLESFIEEAALVSYITTSPTALRIGSDLKEVVGWITKQAREIGPIDDVQPIMAMDVLGRFNRMGSVYWRFKRDHIEYELPYAEFLPCRWYLEVLRFLQAFDPSNYPMMASWEEFFLVLPQEMPLSGGVPRIEIKFKDYRPFALYGKFQHWYAENKATGRNPDFREEYCGELTTLSDPELLEELGKMNWGMRLVQAEIRRRRGPV